MCDVHRRRTMCGMRTECLDHGWPTQFCSEYMRQLLKQN